MENARFDPVADILKKKLFLPFELSIRELLNQLHSMNWDAMNNDKWITINGQHIEVNENGEQISGTPKVLGSSKSGKTEKKSEKSEKTIDYKAAREYSKSIKGVITVNGTEMKKVSGHAAYRMKERGLSVDDVKDALTGAGISYPGNMKHPDAECYQHKGMRMVVSPNGVLISAINLEAN